MGFPFVIFNKIREVARASLLNPEYLRKVGKCVGFQYFHCLKLYHAQAIKVDLLIPEFGYIEMMIGM